MAYPSICFITLTTTPLLDPAKLPLLCLTILSIAVTYWAARTVRRNSTKSGVALRPIPGLAAFDEAIGRATEMGQPVLFTTGWGGDIQRPTTIAALSIFSEVAARTIQNRTKLLFPTHDPVILAVAQEIFREKSLALADPAGAAGELSFVSTSQFGYAAAVDGLLVREKPAAVFLVGTFEAESLLLAETGNTIGAIQVAGTDSTIQLAFFVVACDYTLIGEEVFAAAGVLSQEPDLIGTILAQDWLKLLIAAVLIAGTISASLSPAWSWWK